MAAQVRFFTRLGAEVLVPVDAPTAADLDRAVLELQRELGRLRWRACSPPPGGHLFPLENETDFDWALLAAERGKGAGDKADEDGVWAHDGFYTRRMLEPNPRKNLKPAIKYSRGARPTDPPEVVEGDGDIRYVTLAIFRGGDRREELAVPRGGGRLAESRAAASTREEPAGGDAEGERTTAELAPQDYVNMVVEAAERLKDGVRGTIGVAGVGGVRDVRAWVLEHRDRLLEPAVYRIVSGVVAELLANHRNRRKATAGGAGGNSSAPAGTPAGDAEPGGRLSSEEELHAAHLEYIKSAGPKAGDAAQIILGKRNRNLKRYVREEWGLIKSNPAAAKGVVEAIERTTRIPFAALTGDAGGEEPAQQQRTKGGR